MFHIGGLGVHTLPLLYIGGTNTILPVFEPENVLATMARERVTVQFLVPVMWAALLAVPGFDNYDLSALELAVTGGAPCPLPVLEYFQGKGVPFQESFGMTEIAGRFDPRRRSRQGEGGFGRASLVPRGDSHRRRERPRCARWRGG